MVTWVLNVPSDHRPAHPEQRLDRALLLEDRHLPSLLDLAADCTIQTAAIATNSWRSLRLFANKTNF